jgi:hypothetical protein
MVKTGTAESYYVFVRNWWRENPDWPNGLEPCGSGRRHTLAKGCTAEEARAIAQEYNRTHKPGRLSRKAEWDRER